MDSKILFAVCLATLSITTLPSLSAQQATAPSANQSIPSESVPESRGSWPSPEEAVARMSSKLNLSDDQKTKITPIIADRQSQMRALMADTSGERLQKARKVKSIMSDSDKKIEAVLTKDQKKTYEEMKEERGEEMRSRMQQRNGGNPQQ